MNKEMKPLFFIDTAVFDLGNVLIRWNPRNLYRKMFDDEKAMEDFLSNVCSSEWNYRIDRGQPWQEAIDEAVARFPDKEVYIRAYRERWEEMLNGTIDESISILKELKTAGIRVFALTNWSNDTFTIAEGLFPVLKQFDGILVSGREHMAKPEQKIFSLLCSRYRVYPERAVFIDDMPYNVEAGIKAGFHAVRFTSPEKLRQDLLTLGLPLKKK